MAREYQICTNCVMDTTDPKITFNEEGICTHCRRLGIFHRGDVMKLEVSEEKLKKLISEIKEAGKNKAYDCILGVSGGLDSSYLAYLAYKYELRPLCVHLDNGWDSELAVKNIERVVKKFKFNLYTHVIDWGEFKDLQLSFFKAGVLDIEVLTDHAITAIIYQQASLNEVKYILSGWNLALENTMPYSWNYYKLDTLNILDIHRHFGSKPIKTFPLIDGYRYYVYQSLEGIKSAHLLNLVHYSKEEALSFLDKECGYKYYGDKHYESVFTRFYQSYILPEKFKIDKRKAHLSALIHSGQISKEFALEELKKPTYDPKKLKEDKEFVLKKLDFSEKDFEIYMNSPIKEHTHYLSGLPPRQ
ncbi:MAG: ExsB family protein [uncultured bacterium]|nr:MAG: ExsB family protein [uncultured bacterium]